MFNLFLFISLSYLSLPGFYTSVSVLLSILLFDLCVFVCLFSFFYFSLFLFLCLSSQAHSCFCCLSLPSSNLLSERKAPVMLVYCIVSSLYRLSQGFLSEPFCSNTFAISTSSISYITSLLSASAAQPYRGPLRNVEAKRLFLI
jgi:hypothetical protein